VKKFEITFSVIKHTNPQEMTFALMTFAVVVASHHMCSAAIVQNQNKSAGYVFEMERVKKSADTWFIHYFDSGAKSWSEQGGTRIAREAAAYFDHVITYRKTDLGCDFLDQHQAHFRHSRGAGYYVWKPRIVQLTLQQMQYNDILLYADTGCELIGSPAPLLQLLDNQDAVPFHLEEDYLKEAYWTKNDLFMAMNWTGDKYQQQRVGGYFLVRKTQKTIELFDEYLKYASDLHLINDSPSTTPNDPGFKEHRHDQSIWSILTKQYNYTSYPDPGWPLDRSTIIKASRRTG